MRPITIGEEGYVAPIPFDELKGACLKEWEKYLGSAELRDASREIIAEALGTLAFPSIEIGRDHTGKNRELALKLRNANHNIATYLLPHISDAEAQKVLGSHYIAEMVYQTVTLANARFFMFDWSTPVKQDELLAYHQSLRTPGAVKAI